MKRLYSIFLAGVALVAVASCGNRGKKAQVVMPEEEVVETVAEDASVVKMYSNSYDGYTNVRKSPSSKGEVLGKLRNGNEYVVVIGEVDNWYEVEYYDQIGYVHKNYVSETPSKPVTVDVDANWVEGIWFLEGGWQCYLIFSNGKYTVVGEWYENIVAGKWHLEEDNIVFTPKYFNKESRWWDESFREVEIMKINKAAGTMGQSQKCSFSDPNDEEYQCRGSMEWSKADFNAEKKWVNARVK